MRQHAGKFQQEFFRGKNFPFHVRNILEMSLVQRKKVVRIFNLERCGYDCVGIFYHLALGYEICELLIKFIASSFLLSISTKIVVSRTILIPLSQAFSAVLFRLFLSWTELCRTVQAKNRRTCQRFWGLAC